MKEKWRKPKGEKRTWFGPRPKAEKKQTGGQTGKAATEPEEKKSGEVKPAH